MNEFSKLIGKWKHPSPWDSEDYLSIYSVSGTETSPIVVAQDLNDGEEFEISDVSWNGSVLSFVSLMPSTMRKGFNRFWLSKSGALMSEFTFTVVEELEREGM